MTVPLELLAPARDADIERLAHHAHLYHVRVLMALNATLRFDCKKCEMHVVGRLRKNRELHLCATH